jgi:hypothetical protein
MTPADRLVAAITSRTAWLWRPDTRQALCATFVILALNYPARAQQQLAAVPVGVAIAERKPIAKAGDFVGRGEAINWVEIRARKVCLRRFRCSFKTN